MHSAGLNSQWFLAKYLGILTCQTLGITGDGCGMPAKIISVQCTNDYLSVVVVHLFNNGLEFVSEKTSRDSAPSLSIKKFPC